MKNPTLQVLREIRDEVKATNTRLDTTIERLDMTNERLDATVERLDVTNERIDGLARRLTETDLRLSTEIIAVGHAVDRVSDLLRDRLDLRDRVENHERRITSLEGRTTS